MNKTYTIFPEKNKFKGRNAIFAYTEYFFSLFRDAASNLMSNEH